MSDLQCMGGGVAMSNRCLDEDLLALPAPCAALPPSIVRGERFCRLQKDASYICDGCAGLQGAAGTRDDDDARTSPEPRAGIHEGQELQMPLRDMLGQVPGK
eukprot:7088102-Pyramimonas_sp.AAC.1